MYMTEAVRAPHLRHGKLELRTPERWQSGRMRRFAKPLYGLTPVPRVRIPPSPPDFLPNSSSNESCIASGRIITSRLFRLNPALRAHVSVRARCAVSPLGVNALGARRVRPASVPALRPA